MVCGSWRIEAYRDAAVLAGMLLAARGRFPNFGPYQDPVPLAIGHIRERMGTRLTEVALSEGKWDWPASPFPQRNELRPNDDRRY